MAWFSRNWSLKKKKVEENRVSIPEGLWTKCDHCKEIIYQKEIEKNFQVCPKCNYHFRISAAERICLLADAGTFEEHDSQLAPMDPLKFKDHKKYKDRVKLATKKVGIKEAVICGMAHLNGYPIQLCVFEFAFMGGSMGSVVGEKIARAIERALDQGAPLVIVSCSGGARMQEGILSLMQMAKVSSCLAQLSQAGLPFISVLTDPTTGGVTASLAMLGDLIIAEPGALIGFAGPRVIEQTIKQKLPEGFQRAEFLLQHGIIDMVVERKDLKDCLGKLVGYLTYSHSI
ncbi:MAG: acetyl-CoA carboxylase carboxyltransferase subunit beta [Candidatus Tectomicrobia bacterium]|uniref:Acetyl-coenzyme A carboxylase carboxyl transferase subunit beta n=1 Tax=Tectimicrobiota bacterium TaxID=2528274 RepID=A0A932G208_UNCTE|nr:acetyl-CoA carboxylase carboxyltransferase subunit beta [Candidatus Tectomicrobia bacterium]